MPQYGWQEYSYYTVRLGLADGENSTPKQRVFAIRLQYKLAAEDFDIVGAADGADNAVVREFQGIEIVREVTDLAAKPPT